MPVALSSNRFAVGLDEAHGALLVDELDELAPALRALLADSSRWETMSRRGRETAPAEVDWGRYVERVDTFLRRPSHEDPARSPRAGIGVALEDWLDQTRAELDRKSTELAVAARDLTEAATKQQRMIEEISYLRTLHDRLCEERDQFARESNELRAEENRVRARRIG